MAMRKGGDGGRKMKDSGQGKIKNKENMKR